MFVCNLCWVGSISIVNQLSLFFPENEGKGRKIIKDKQVTGKAFPCHLFSSPVHCILLLSLGSSAFKQKTRKHGWQLPYHPLQVVAVAVFLALAFAFYVFFAPSVGNKDFSVHCDGPLRSSSADPADPGVFRSKKYLKIPANEKHTRRKDSKLSTSFMRDANTVTVVGKLLDKDVLGKEATSKMSTSESVIVERRMHLKLRLASCWLALRVLISAIALVRVRNLLCNK